ncbi:hypothetical protein KOR42_29020 [Thalassoglobus neptunius]|uniref:Uncharacterized protein n=1 Tax=Thalassoglobus neptunius TaxID=1938619 RepID=A0A5C5WZC0_9PLAN|nr:hypothetical protein [Thalassoglobus neptunius]TWT55275.1 hypothetical protein KOR42_29020 [Thalassoglobus neptunius]
MSASESVQKAKKPVSLLIAVVIGAVWLSLLLWLTVQYANPVILNRSQILRSQAVLDGRFPTLENEFIAVEDEESQEKSQPVRFTNFSELTVQPDQEYLVPVIIDGDKITVTPSPIKDIPLIYPATDEARKQLAEIAPSAAKK